MQASAVPESVFQISALVRRRADADSRGSAVRRFRTGEGNEIGFLHLSQSPIVDVIRAVAFERGVQSVRG